MRPQELYVSNDGGDENPPYESYILAQTAVTVIGKLFGLQMLNSVCPHGKAGGTKKRQQEDIRQAKANWEDYRKRKKQENTGWH